MKTMTTEFDGLVKSFRGNELQFFTEQILEIVLVHMPESPANSNQTVTDRCRALMNSIDLNEMVMRQITTRLNTK